MYNNYGSNGIGIGFYLFFIFLMIIAMTNDSGQSWDRDEVTNSVYSIVQSSDNVYDDVNNKLKEYKIDYDYKTGEVTSVRDDYVVINDSTHINGKVIRYLNTDKIHKNQSAIISIDEEIIIIEGKN
jgi:hypothetical protein